MSNPKRYLITAALPYANGQKHIGHLAGAYLPADIYVRWLKAQKKDVVFICGSDEHGTAIPIQATKEGTTPQAIIDKYHPQIEQNFKDLHIDFNIYHRTSSPIHHQTAHQFFVDMLNAGELEAHETEQYFDEEAQTFLADRFIKGTCPNCSNDNAFGDQCEKCGTSLSPEMLINPVSTLSGQVPVKKSTRHYYLPLNRHEQFLRQWITEEHKEDWRANVLGQCKSWLDGGLQPRAITRDLDWGVQVPEAGEGKVLYVWFDAPIGYISATKQWALDNGRNWEDYWNDADTQLVHFIGKDNIVFHCIIFPVMLKRHGHILPAFVPANEFLNLEGDKMSTSRNWKLDMEDYIEDFVRPENGGPQMADALRYYLTAIAPETKDAEFTWKGFQEAVNSELVAVFANFVNRSMVLMHKLCGGKVPAFHAALKDEHDDALLAELAAKKMEIDSLFKAFKFREAQYAVIDLARTGNQYLQRKEPWKKVAKEGQITSPESQQLIDNCMHLSLQLTANLAIFINPFLPATARKMLHMMKVVERMLDWENAGSLKLLSVGYNLRPPELLFRKIEDAEVTQQIEKLKAKSAAAMSETPNAETPANTDVEAVEAAAEKPAYKPEIQFDDFAKIDLRVGTILTAEKVKKADKLLHLTVDMGGGEVRNIVSGIAQHFEPENIIGQQVTVVCNLAPRKMKGIESQGMILMAEDADGKLKFVAPNEQVASGSGVS